MLYIRSIYVRNFEIAVASWFIIANFIIKKMDRRSEKPTKFQAMENASFGKWSCLHSGVKMILHAYTQTHTLAHGWYLPYTRNIFLFFGTKAFICSFEKRLTNQWLMFIFVYLSIEENRQDAIIFRKNIFKIVSKQIFFAQRITVSE